MRLVELVEKVGACKRVTRKILGEIAHFLDEVISVCKPSSRGVKLARKALVGI